MRTALLGGLRLGLPSAPPADPGRRFGARAQLALERLYDRVAGWWSGRPVAQPAKAPRRGLVKLLAAGAALRLWFTLSYRPGFTGYPDARAYIIAARGPLYWNAYKPVGYPLLLRALRGLDSRLSVTVIVQHLLGLATGALVYLATAPFLRRPGLAQLPAAIVLFGGSQVFLEHSILSDAPYTFLLTATLYCAVRSLTTRVRGGWLAGAGVLLAASVTMRTVGLFLIPAVAAWAFGSAGLPPDTLNPYVAAAVVLVPAVLLLVGYTIPQHAVTGRWGLTRSTSFAFYARMAPLADCARFRPPPGTAGLCERSDPRTRPNANWYIFSLDAPAIRCYGVPPWPLTPVAASQYEWSGEQPTGRFALTVLAHQPLDYLATVLEGLANYVRPRTGRPSVFEYDQEMLIRELHNEHYEREALADISSYYSTAPGYLRRRVGALDAYGRLARTEGPLTGVLAVLGLTGWALSRDSARSASSLLLSTSILLAALPVAILFYDVRYAVPMIVPLTAAAAIGIDRLWDMVGRSGVND